MREYRKGLVRHFQDDTFCNELQVALPELFWYPPASANHHNTGDFFSDEEASLVDLMNEQIIPTDDTPGAIEAGCVNFIDKQLVGPCSRQQNDYRQGLHCLQTTCQAKCALPFQELDWPARTTFILSRVKIVMPRAFRDEN